MKLRWTVGVVFAVIAVPLIAIVWSRMRGVQAFQEELRLARADGIPTSAAEYAATIPRSEPAENAADLYRALKPTVSGPKGDPRQIDADLLRAPGKETMRSALDHLRMSTSRLTLIDQAVTRRRCWFDRDWSEGAAVLMPEFAYIKGAAALVALRGSVESLRGDHTAALTEAAKMEQLAVHAGEEGNGISQAVQASIHFQVLRHLAVWASLHPDRSEYRRRMDDVIQRFPKPNLKKEHAGDLYQLLDLVNLSETPEGRRKLGLKEEDVSSLEPFAPILLSRNMARVDIVKAQRRLWAEFVSASPDPVRIEAAQWDRQRALRAFPTAYDVSTALSEGEWAHDPRRRPALLQQYTALSRALSAKGVTQTIRTHDLRSPFDGKPLTYRFDGQTLAIDVSGLEEPWEIPIRNGKTIQTTRFAKE